MKKFSFKRYLAGILSLCLILPHTSYACTNDDNLYNEHVKKLVLPKSYDFDDNGNVSVIKYDNTPKIWYFYDDKKQLIRENNAFQNETIVYKYDKRGNMLSKTIYDFTCDEIQDKSPKNCMTYTYDEEDKLICYNGQEITYDEFGNVLKYKNGWNFKWDNGTMSEANNSENRITYSYNDEGRRLTKQVNDTLFDYDFTDEHLIQKSGQHTIRWYLPGEKGLKHFNCDGKDYSYICNLESDVIAIIDGNNKCVANYTYDSWGKLISITDEYGNDVTNDMNHIGNINPLRYRGYYYDTETGLYYLYSRYYDPETGRFLSKDDDQYLSEEYPNAYVYCMNNPVNKADYDGHEAITLAVCLATADVAVVGTATLVFAAASAMSIMQPKIKGVVDKAIDWAVKSFITIGSAIRAKFKELGEHLANLIGNLAKDYNIYLAKQKVPSKAKDGDKVKTPDSHPDEFQKNKDGSYTHKSTGWKMKNDPSGHGGRHWDLSPPNGRGHLNVGPAGNIFGGRL